MTEAWFSAQLAPWFALFSLFSLCSYMTIWAQQGRHRAWVLGSFWASVALGAMLLLLGVVAYLSSQPKWVWATLMLTGGLLAPLMYGATRKIQRAYEDAELRRSIASDL